MHYRALGRTGITVSEIGFGGWGIGGGWGSTDDTESLAALHRAVDSGVTFVDTAWMYGDGHSERLIGQVLATRRESVQVASKAPPANRVFPTPHDTPLAEAFPPGHLRSHTEQSLRRLGLESLDLQQLHVWSPQWLDESSLWDEVASLKDEGKIGAFGVSLNDHQPESGLSLVRSGLVDTVQTIYNIFDQSPEDLLLPTCLEHGVGVIVRVPLDEGGLTGTLTADTILAPGDWRHHYFRADRLAELDRRVTEIVNHLEIDRDQLAEIALRYVLSHPAVSTVVPGMRRVNNVDRNVSVADGRGLDSQQVRELRAHRWVRNFYA